MDEFLINLAFSLTDIYCLYNILQIDYFRYVLFTHETSMSKIVKIFQGPTDRPTDRPTDMTTPRSSDPELKNHNSFDISHD